MGNLFRRWFGEDQPAQEIDVEEPPFEVIQVEGQQGGHPPNAANEVQPKPEQTDPQPDGTFQCLPDDYAAKHPNFEMCNNKEANEIANGVKLIFLQRVIEPRQAIDTKLRLFREKTGKSPDAALPTCFDSWKKEAFKYSTHIDTEDAAFEVKKNSSEQVIKIAPNEREENLTEEVNEMTVEMNSLLDTCHNFLSQQEETEQLLRAEKERFNTLKQLSMKAREMKNRVDGLVTELIEQVKQVNALLTDIRAAVSNQGIRVRSKITTGLHRAIPDHN